MHHTPPAALLAELAKAAEAIAASPAASAGPLWGAMHKLLLKARADPKLVARLITSRDATGLAALVRTLRGESSGLADLATVAAIASATDPVPTAIDPEILKSAMRAFKKRLRLARLDQESSLGVGPMSSGKRNDIDAIVPPREFPIEVWGALANAGRLRRAGAGLYQLVDELPEE